VTEEACPTCRKPRAICVCDRTVALPVATRVLVLQHPQEPDQVLGTAPLLAGAVAAKIVVGLSWRSLAHAWGEEVDPHRWGVLWRGSATEPGVFDAKGTPWTERLDGIVALDGTWTQAKALWWRNAWLTKLARVVLMPKEPTIYGRLRRSPNRSSVSTLEAVAQALVENGEDPAVKKALEALMRTMCQRARDAA
jgi:DTW domain-containing protein YfiP